MYWESQLVHSVRCVLPCMPVFSTTHIYTSHKLMHLLFNLIAPLNRGNTCMAFVGVRKHYRFLLAS